MDGRETLREPLTQREIEVLCLLVEWISNREFAQKLIIAPGTVNWYNKQIYDELNVK